MKRTPPELLVIGVGNPDRGDDAAGPAVAELLRQKAPEGIRAMVHEGEGTALIDSWTGADRVIVVDAVSSGAAPGTIRRMDGGAADLPAAYFRGSTHAFSVADALKLARAMHQLPAKIMVYGIEGERFQLGTGLSEPVAQAVEEVVQEIAEREASHA